MAVNRCPRFPRWRRVSGGSRVPTSIAIAGWFTAVQFASDPAAELARVAEKKTSVRGSFSAGDEVGDEVFARLQGVRGLTDLRVNFKTGVLQVVIEPAPLLPQLVECVRADRASKLSSRALMVLTPSTNHNILCPFSVPAPTSMERAEKGTR